MRIISKWFWEILQHISAPSEKEIRESLINRLIAVALIAFLGTAPAYSLPLTPDQAEVKAEQELQIRYSQEAEELELRFNDLVLFDLKQGKYTHCFYLNMEYNEEAITLFKNNLQRTNWDVYDNCAPTDNRMLKIVRHNTVPE